MNGRQKHDKSTTRGNNRRLILNCLRQAGELSRVDLIEMTGLAGSTVTILVADLQAEGFVVERDKGQSRGGRKPIFLAIDYQGHHAIGIKLMHDRIDATLTDLATAPLAGLSAPLLDREPAAVAQSIATLCRELLQTARLSADRLVGVGLALPGFIDAEAGICILSARLGWKDVPVARMVADRTGLVVKIDNDVNAYAIAHQLFGAAKSKQSVLAVIAGVGVGAALITTGGLHRGWRSRAGEIGFIRDDPGPWARPEEALSWGDRFSESVLESQWIALSESHGVRGMPLAEAASLGIAAATDLLAEFGRALGWRIAAMVGVVDPEVVVLGGEAMRFGRPLTDPLIAAYNAATGSAAAEITVDRDNDIWTRGAAALAIQSFFSSPQS